MKLTKFKKVIITTTIATLSLGVVSSAAVVYSNLKVHYNVNLVVNGSQYTGTSEATKPFLTESGRTYISVASLVESGIANAAYDANTSTVTVTSGTTDQSKITALSNQILALENKNAVLEAEIATLKKGSGSSSGSTSTGDLLLSSLTKSSDRTTLERDIVKELRSLKASLTDFGTIRFDDAATAKIYQSSNKIVINMFDTSVYGSKSTSSSRAASWNSSINGKYEDDIEEDLETFIEEEVLSVVRDILSDYKEYDIEVNINGYKDSTDDSAVYNIAYGKYSNSKDTLKITTYDID